MSKMYVDSSSKVVNVIGKENSAIYKNCDVQNSLLGVKTTIGDFSRVSDCCLDEYVKIQRNAMMYSVDMGKYSYTGKNFTAWHCKIGAYCSISWNVSIGGANHDYNRATTHSFLYAKEFDMYNEGEQVLEPPYDRFADVCEVGNDVWIAANACVCRGVRIGTGAVIAAGAVVTKDVEPYTIVAGVPARPIKRRFSDEICHMLLESRWWEFPTPEIRENFKLFGKIMDHNVAREILDLRKQIDKGGK